MINRIVISIVSVTILLCLSLYSAAEELPHQTVSPQMQQKIEIPASTPEAQKKQKIQNPAAASGGQGAEETVTVHRRSVQKLKRVKGGEEAEVVLTGKNLDRVTSAKLRGAQVLILKKTPTELRLKLTGKGRALERDAVRLTLTAGQEKTEVSLGNEMKKARQLAVKPNIDRWKEDIKKTETIKGAGKTLEMEKARDTARTTDLPEFTSPGAASRAGDVKKPTFTSPGARARHPDAPSPGPIPRSVEFNNVDFIGSLHIRSIELNDIDFIGSLYSRSIEFRNVDFIGSLHARSIELSGIDFIGSPYSRTIEIDGIDFIGTFSESR